MDLYATGTMLAEMLSGEPTLTCSVAEACLAQLDPRRIPLPGFLESSRLWPVIWRATDKSLATRYGTANEMLGELERVYDQLSTAPLVARASGADGARTSVVPTSVMRTPDPRGSADVTVGGGRTGARAAERALARGHRNAVARRHRGDGLRSVLGSDAGRALRSRPERSRSTERQPPAAR